MALSWMLLWGKRLWGRRHKKIYKQILSLSYDLDLIVYYHDLAFKIFISAYYLTRSHNYFNITAEEFRSLMEPMLISNIDLPRISEVINHPYVTEKIKGFLKRSNKENNKLVEEFFLAVLTEAYEQRNFIEHNGVFFEKSVDKVLLSLPMCVNKFRSLVVQKALENQYSSFKEIIIDLSKPSK